MANYPNYYMYNPNFQSQQTYQPNNQSIQNGGFITAPNESYARSYPVAPGNSVTFRDESAPYIYTKTMGFSQLDIPVFEKYKLIKEEATEEPQKVDDIETIKNKINDLWSEIDQLKKQIRKEKNDE